MILSPIILVLYHFRFPDLITFEYYSSAFPLSLSLSLSLSLLLALPCYTSIPFSFIFFLFIHLSPSFQFHFLPVHPLPFYPLVDESTLEPLLAFAARYVSHPRYARLIVVVTHKILDLYASVLGHSDSIDELFLKLHRQVRELLSDICSYLLLSVTFSLSNSVFSFSLSPLTHTHTHIHINILFSFYLSLPSIPYYFLSVRRSRR